MSRIFLGLGALALASSRRSAARPLSERVKAGTLVCDVSGGIGMIIASQKGVQCPFNPDLPGPPEAYFGTISKFGLDIGATSAGQMVWAVYAPSTGVFGRPCRHLYRCDGRSDSRGRPGRQRAGRRLQSHGRAATFVGDGPDRPQSGGGRRLARVASGALSAHFMTVLAAACGRPFRLVRHRLLPVRAHLRRYCDRAGKPGPTSRPAREVFMGQNGTGPRGPRCIALVGPFQSGKTTLLEAILARTGAVQRQGTVDAGTTVGDASKEARQSQDERRGLGRHHHFHGRQLHLHRLPRLDRIHP